MLNTDLIVVNTVVNELNKRGYKAELTSVFKNGIEKVHVVIGNGKVRPSIDVDSLLVDGAHNIDGIVSRAIAIYSNSLNTSFDVPNIITWNYAKDHLQLCLQGKTNEPILKRHYLDLEMYVRVKVSEDGTYKVKPGMFKEISEDEIFARALLTTKNNIVVEDMGKMLAEMMGGVLDFADIMGACPPMPQPIVISNTEKTFGSAGICDKELLSKIAKEHNSNFVIIPSSIHECIIHLDNDPNMKEYNAMVREINATEVAPEEELSDYAYFFNKDTLEITW